MFLFLVEAAVVLLILLALAWFICMLIADSDVLLFLKTKYGKQPESLSGKVVWVTGASSGIGEYYAYCLAENGCKLVLSARRKDELDRVKDACLALENCKIKESDILVVPLDITEHWGHPEKVERVLGHFKQIDILINNAGKSQRAPWLDTELEVDRHLFDVNVLGPVSLTQAVLPHMIERKEGHIVVVSSLAGKMGAPVSRSYTGSKHAVQGFFDALRLEMADQNIDVTVICPGPVYSNFAEAAATGKMGETVNRPMDLTEKRMTRERCAYLSCVAIANRQYEAWVTQRPFLQLAYVFQYAPDVGKWLSARLGTKQIMKMRECKTK